MTERITRREMLELLGGAAAAGLVVSCGGSSAGAGGAPTRAVVAQGVDPTTMDPHQQRETTTANVLRHLYDPLVERDAADPQKFNGVLATGWRQVDPTTLRLQLRPNVKFSDGRPLDAATVAYNVDRVLGNVPGGKPALIAYLFPSLKGAAVVDAHTVDIQTKAPDPVLVPLLSELMIVPDHAVDKDPNALAANPVGTGPYRLVQWDRNNQVVMQAKPDYFRGPAQIKQVTFKTMPDASSRLAGLETGDVDIITNLPPDNVKDAESSGRAIVRTVPSDRVVAVWLDTLANPILAKPEVRVALNYAVDADTIVRTVMDGYAVRLATIVPPYFAGYAPDVKPYPYDPGRARSLLAAAGYPNGFGMHMMVPRGRYLNGEQIAQAVAGYLGKVGVRVQIDVVEFGVFAKATQQRHIQDSFLGADGEPTLDPTPLMQTVVVTGNTGFSWYSNPNVDQAVARAASTVDPAQHARALQAAQVALQADPAFIYLFAYKDLYGVSKRLSWRPRTDEQVYLYGTR
jgi:peptide/nickel transport system substrate-binding protein